MCGRYVPLNAEELRKMRNSLHGISINIDTEESVLLGESRKEIFPSDRALSLVQDKDGVKLAGGVWGFPSPYGKGVIFNARCESAETKPMFRDLIRNGRCASLMPTRWIAIPRASARFCTSCTDTRKTTAAGCI